MSGLSFPWWTDMQTAFDARPLPDLNGRRAGHGAIAVPPMPAPGVRPGCGLVVQVVDRPGFLRLEKDWNALVEATHDEPFYRHEYIRSWIDSFVPGARLRILTGHDPAGKLVAALPLVADRGFLYGVPVRRLVSPTSLHSARFDLIAADRRSAARAFMNALAADGSWDVVRITEVPAGGNAWDLHDAAREAGFPAGAWESHHSPFVPLPDSYDALAANLSSKFKANLRRRRSRLEERGAVSVERVTGGVALEAGLEELFALERAGWKGRQGSAALQSSKTLGFYAGLAHAAARGEYVSLTFLKVGGRTIAAQYGLTRRGVYSLMMTCYDEQFREYGPGHLLMEDVLRGCIASGLSRFDFLGCSGAWKLDWAPVVHAHHWLFLFRDSLLGRTLRKAKFGWIPGAKEGLRSWRARLAAGTRGTLAFEVLTSSLPE